MRLIVALALYALLLGGFLLYPKENQTITAVPVVAEAGTVLSATIERNPELEYINFLRVERGLTQLKEDIELKDATSVRAYEMSDSFTYSHTRADGGNYSDLLSLQSKEVFSCENLQLQSNKSIEDAVDAWLESPGHEYCLLHSQTTRAAVSVEKFGDDDEMTSWLFVFIAVANE